MDSKTNAIEKHLKKDKNKYNRTVPHFSTAKKMVPEKPTFLSMGIDELPGIIKGPVKGITIKNIIDTKAEHYPTDIQLDRAKDQPYKSSKKQNHGNDNQA